MASRVCPNCHAECENEAGDFCPYCGQALNGGANINVPKGDKKHSTLKIILLICLVVFLTPILLFAGCMSCSVAVSSISGGDDSSNVSSEAQTEMQQIKVGEPFVSDEIEYTIDSIGYGNQGDGGYLYLDYTAINRSDSAENIIGLPGSLYSPDGKSIKSKSLVSLDMFAPTTDDILPGYSTSGSEAWELAGSGNYTLLIEDFGFDGRMEFAVQLPEDDGGDIVLTYETGNGTETQSFDM